MSINGHFSWKWSKKSKKKVTGRKMSKDMKIKIGKALKGKKYYKEEVIKKPMPILI